MNCQLVAEAVGARGPGWTWCPEEACQSSWPCSAGSGSWSRAAGRPVEGGPVQAGGTPASFGLHGGGQGSGHEGEISGAGEAGQTSSRPQGDTERVGGGSPQVLIPFTTSAGSHWNRGGSPSRNNRSPNLTLFLSFFINDQETAYNPLYRTDLENRIYRHVYYFCFLSPELLFCRKHILPLEW